MALEDQAALYQKEKLTCDDIPKSYLTISGFNYGSPYYPKQNVRLIRRELEKVGYACNVLPPVVDTPLESEEGQEKEETSLDTTQRNMENAE